MLKIVNKNCAGIDVHKKIIVVTIAKTNEQDITNYQTKSFNTFTEDLISCRDWLVSNGTFDVCMESTGKYWIPVFNILEEKCKCIITHPKYVRTIPGKKTDKKDSIWIADMFKHGLVEPSFMPPADIRQLRDLMRYRNKLINIRSGEKNRFQNSLTMSNVQIANVVTDVFGKTSQSILKLMLSNPNLTLEIGTNMNTFVDDKHLCSWAGLTPRCNESAKKKKSVRITKAGIYIKPLLIQCALCAIKDNSCPYIKARYESLKRRRGHKKAIIAIARLLLTSAYHILLTGQVFDYNRFENLMNRNFKSHKNIQNTPEEMISYLTNLGYNITLQNT